MAESSSDGAIKNPTLDNNDSRTTKTITTSAALFSIPSDPSFVYPVSDFPDLSIFEESAVHPALIVPARQTAQLRNRLSHVILHHRLPKTCKSVHPVPGDDSKRKLLLIQSDDNNNDNDDDTIFDKDPILKQVIQESQGECTKSSTTLQVSYSDWTVERVLRRLLPVSEIPSAFEAVGTIAHVNLREELLPFKYIVGKVILDKNAPRIGTVVNKLASIDTKYRTFGMEVIAGNEKEGWSQVTVKEEGCQYELDFQHVYWNSRLAGEHRRLVKLLRKEAALRHHDGPLVVADLMAGVGPFAVPLTAAAFQNVNHNMQVHANDLNPISYQYLVRNAKKNKCESCLHCYNMDGRALVHDLVDRGVDVHHVIMNLPASAPECLDAFRGYAGKWLPRLHVHCFAEKSADAEDQALERCSRALQCPLDQSQQHVTVHVVRDVSPNKNMLCVSFTLPEQVRKLPRVLIEDKPMTDAKESEPPDAKRLKR